MSPIIDGRYIQDHFPGIGRYTFNLIDALARVAPAESFVVLHNPALRNTRYDVAALARHPNVKLRRVDVPTLSLREQFQLPITNSPLLLPYSNAQLFHSPYFIKPYFAAVPSVVTIFDLIPLRFPDDVPSARARLVFRWAVWLAARVSARVIAPSAATANDLVGRLGVPRAKIATIPLAADARFAPQPASKIARVREKYALPLPYALTVGINKPHKNLRTLISAWERVESQDALVIAGAWDERYAGERVSRPRDFCGGGSGAGEIRFLHNVSDEDLPALYAGATLFVMPSLYEGFGLPALEAMACGAPVVCSNAASLPEVVGDAALGFDPRDADALAALIARVLNDRALRDELRAQSLARAAQYSWERTARETLAVYKSVSAQVSS